MKIQSNYFEENSECFFRMKHFLVIPHLICFHEIFLYNIISVLRILFYKYKSSETF